MPRRTGRRWRVRSQRGLPRGFGRAVRATKKVLVEQTDKPYRNGFLLEAQCFAQLIADRASEE